VYDLATWFNWRPLSRAGTVLRSNWAPCLNPIVLPRIHAPVKDHYWNNHPIGSPWWLLCGLKASLEAHLFIELRLSTFIISCSEAWAEVLLQMQQWPSIRPMVVNAVMTKEPISSLPTTFSRWWAWSLCGTSYIYPRLGRKPIVRWLYITPPPHLAGCNAPVIR